MLFNNGVDGFLEFFDQSWVHRSKTVFDLEDVDVAVATELGVLFANPLLVVILHDEHQIRPIQILLGENSLGASTCSSRAHFERSVVSINGFGGGTAPLISRTDEEEF